VKLLAASAQLLAKLASGLHKPDDQTILPPTVAAAFIAPLPLRCGDASSRFPCRLVKAEALFSLHA